MSTNKIKVITPDNLGKGITYNPQTKQWEASSGFDCASFEALPLKPWKKGTSILAKQDGECVRLTSLDSIFQEIGVGITANRNSAFVNEAYNVVVTVTNTGESKNELSNLVVQKPLLGDYEIKDIRTSKDGVDEVETLNELSYNLKGIAKGGTFILRFTVVAKAAGTFQFTANVNSNTDLDLDSKNNAATIILTASTKEDAGYIPSVDCPRITATDVETGVELRAYPIEGNGRSESYVFIYKGANIYANKTELNGTKIRLDGASSVAVIPMYNALTNTTFELSNGAIAYTYSRQTASHADLKISSTIESYDFADGVLTISTPRLGACIVLCRPAGKNCKWQIFALYASKPPVSRKIIESDVIGGVVERVNIYNGSYNSSDSYNEPVIIPNTVTYKTTSKQLNTSIGDTVEVISKLIFRVKAGTAASFNFTKSYSNIRTPIVRGNTTITENRVEVSANATSTDSINSDYLQVIVED